MGLRERQDKVFHELKNLREDSKVSIVTPAGDFEEDTRTCLTIIHFPPKRVTESVTKEIIEPLRKADPRHYFYPEESLHVTINNVREIAEPPTFTEEDIDKVKGLQLKGRLKFNFDGLFRMSTGIGIKGYPDSATVNFILELRQRLSDIGVHDDKTYVDPEVIIGNISVCRFYGKPNKRFLSVYSQIETIQLGTVNADLISLVRTNGVCHPKKTRILRNWEL
jgi:hypothetical protein